MMRRLFGVEEGESSAHRAVADDGYHVAVFFALFGGGNGHAQRG